MTRGAPGDSSREVELARRGLSPRPPRTSEGADPRRAARVSEEAVDAGKGLPGEDVGTRHVDDADLWIEVYTELVAFKDTVLGAAKEERASLSSVARAEVERTDLVILEGEAERLRRRLRFWRERRAALLDEAGTDSAAG